MTAESSVAAVRHALASNVATVAGSITVLATLLIAHAARRPPTRPLSTAEPRRERPSRRGRAAALIAVGCLVAASTLVAGPLLLVGVIGVVTAVEFRRRRRTRTALRRVVEAAMPDAIELLVLCVHAGRSPAQGVVELARRAPEPLRPGFAAVERQLHRGRGLADALGELPRAIGPSARELASSIAMADREGLPLAPVLDRLAAEARSERRRLGEAAARRLPVRLSFPLVLCTLPSFVLLAIAPAVIGAISTLRGQAP